MKIGDRVQIREGAKGVVERWHSERGKVVSTLGNSRVFLVEMDKTAVRFLLTPHELISIK